MSKLYKGPINRPCSACSAGDAAMEYHDHDYVDEGERRPYKWCVHCAPDKKGLVMYQPEDGDWCYCQCHEAEALSLMYDPYQQAVLDINSIAAKEPETARRELEALRALIALLTDKLPPLEGEHETEPS